MTDSDPSPAPAADQPADKPGGHLTAYIVAAIVAAIVVAMVAPSSAAKLHLGGELFLRLLKMMVVPLVVVSVMSGILGLGDVRKLGRPAGLTVLYYLSTTVLAVVIGSILVNAVAPGRGTVSDERRQQVAGKVTTAEAQRRLLDELATSTALSRDQVAKAVPSLAGGLKQDEPDLGDIAQNLALMLVTDNLVTSAAETNLLPLIVFSIFFAAVLTTLGRRVKTVTDLIVGSNEALMSFVLLIMRVAPIGIFCLVAARFGEAQAKGAFIDELRQTGWYVGTVLGGLAFHAFVTLPLILWLATRRNPYRFMMQMSQALLTAFSTASSTATLPITMESAKLRAGVSERSVDFVLPLGATINMDGTALYEAVAAIFIAQVAGMDLSLAQQLTIIITATLAAIGAAGIPEAGLVTMIIVLNAVGLPVEYIGLILSVDWLLDRFRTAVNVFGDAVGCAVVERSFTRTGPAEAGAAPG